MSDMPKFAVLACGFTESDDGFVAPTNQGMGFHIAGLHTLTYKGCCRFRQSCISRHVDGGSSPLYQHRDDMWLWLAYI